MIPRVIGSRQVFQRRVGKKIQIEDRAGIKVYRPLGWVWLPSFITRSYPGLHQALTRQANDDHSVQGSWYYRSYFQAIERGFAALQTHWGRPDIIHAHVVLPAGWAAARLSQRTSIPIVLTEHSSPFSVHLRNGYHRRLVRDTLQHANQVIAISPALLQQICSFEPAIRSTVIGEVVKTDFFVPVDKENARPTGTTRFLTVALLSEQKGIHYLLEAARNLVQRGITSFECLIGGDGPIRPELEQMARDLQVTDRCRFLGLLDPHQVRDWMQQCTVFVLPSIHETFGVVLGEAMACGKPVIATRSGGAEFVVTPDTGILIDVADSQALANAMARFITGERQYDPQRIRQSIVQRFGEETFLGHITSVYEEIWTKQSCVVSSASGV